MIKLHTPDGQVFDLSLLSALSNTNAPTPGHLPSRKELLRRRCAGIVNLKLRYPLKQARAFGVKIRADCGTLSAISNCIHHHFLGESYSANQNTYNF
jgi:hypothetical protein